MKSNIPPRVNAIAQAAPVRNTIARPAPAPLGSAQGNTLPATGYLKLNGVPFPVATRQFIPLPGES